MNMRRSIQWRMLRFYDLGDLSTDDLANSTTSFLCHQRWWFITIVAYHDCCISRQCILWYNCGWRFSQHHQRWTKRSYFRGTSIIPNHFWPYKKPCHHIQSKGTHGLQPSFSGPAENTYSPWGSKVRSPSAIGAGNLTGSWLHTV